MQFRDGFGAQPDKSKDGTTSIVDAARGKGTLEVRMSFELEGKMTCSKFFV
jgi:hypothetical protein